MVCVCPLALSFSPLAVTVADSELLCSQLCGSEIPSNSSLLGRSLAKLGEVMYVLESQQNSLLKRELKDLLFLSSVLPLCFKESGSL